MAFSPFALIAIFFLIAAATCYARSNFSLIDLFWPLGFVVVASGRLYFEKTPTIATYLLTTLIFVWGLRLFIYLFSRALGRPEDYRYQELRRSWGRHPNIHAFFKIFLLQGALLTAISLPVYLSYTHSDSMTPLRWIAAIAAIIGILIETVADFQVSRFKKIKKLKGEFLKTGLWKYSRHPNYFGELIFWYSVALFTQNIYAFISPLLLNYLLIRFSGIPLLEKKYDGNPQYQLYKKMTRALILWPPKKLNEHADQ